ncbi:hypothetical protein RYX36_036658 [Vicia faba]
MIGDWKSLKMEYEEDGGMFGTVAAAIPFPIVAAVYCVLFAYIASAGLGFLQFCNLNSNRSMVIVEFSLFISLFVPRFLRVLTHTPVDILWVLQQYRKRDKVIVQIDFKF